MARQSNVNAAYSPLNRNAKNAQQSSGGWGKLFGSVAVAAFLIVFLSSGSGGGGKSADDNFMSGQAKRPVAPPMGDATTAMMEQDVNAEMVDEELVEQVKQEAAGDIKLAETSELEKVESKLDKDTKDLGNSIRFGLGSLFGKSLTQEEMEQVAEGVEDKLTTENHNMLRGKAETIATREIDSINSVALEDEQDGLQYTDIRDDVYEHELGAADTVREDIDTEADHIRDSMSLRAAEVEKEILEERLSAKLGKKVKLVIVDNDIKGAEVDGLLQGLDNLVPGAPRPSSSYGGTTGSSYSSPAYGQSYGQQPPAYGQTPPATYGQTPLAYGQTPSYGQVASPAYGQSPSGFGQTTPTTYEQTPSTYGEGTAVPPPDTTVDTPPEIPPSEVAAPTTTATSPSRGFGSLFGWGSKKEPAPEPAQATEDEQEEEAVSEEVPEEDTEDVETESEELLDSSTYDDGETLEEDEEVVYSTEQDEDEDW